MPQVGLTLGSLTAPSPFKKGRGEGSAHPDFGKEGF